MKRSAAVALLLLAAVRATPGSNAVFDRNAISIPHIDLLWDGSAKGVNRTDQEGFLKALEGAGFQVDRISSPVLKEDLQDQSRVLVIPAPAANKLSSNELPVILKYLEEGAILITDAPSPLSEALHIGIHRGLSTKAAYFYCAPDLELRWGDAPVVAYIDPPPNSAVLYRDKRRDRPLAVQFHRGKGTVIFYSALFDPLSGFGFSRYPHLAKILLDLGVSPPFARNAVDVYFDAGYHVGEDIEELAEKWEAWGIRTVHAAVWYMYDKPPFDYQKLVDAAHRHGILVYAWLMWPYVGQGFWNQHPEWREKNALLQDAQLSFLYLMNFQNPDCRGRALADLQNLLRRGEFDGVDLAEFSIAGGVDQSLEGPSHPEHLVGLNDNARAEFKAKKGVDPLELFDRHSSHFWKKSPSLLREFFTYRRDATRALAETVLQQLSGFNRDIGGRLDLVMTVIDSTLHPEFNELMALDLPATIRNTARFGFSLQVEDAADEWSKPPDRYLALAKRYAPLLQGRPFSIDINFEDCHPSDQVGYPTTVPIGSEMHWLWRFAATAASRVCFYAESQIREIDWQTMPAAMGAASTIRIGNGGWEINASHTTYVRMREKLPVALDGHEWPCRHDTRILIPGGSHTLTVAAPGGDPETTQISVLSTTGELVSCRDSNTELETIVESERRCLTRFKGRYHSILVDGAEAHPSSGDDGYWYLFTGAGRHTILVRAAGRRP